MPTAVQLTLDLNMSGATQDLGQFKNELGTFGTQAASTGAKASDAFNGIESAERRAHLGGKLMLQTLGIEMPRALETVIARSQALGPLLAGMFNVSVFLAGAAALGTIVEKITSMTEGMAGYTEEVKKMEQATIDASRQAFIHPATSEVAQQHLNQIHDFVNEARKPAENVMQGTTSEEELEAQGAVQRQVDADHVEKLEQAKKLELEQIDLLNQQADLQRKENLAIDQSNAKSAEAGLQGFALASQQHKDRLKEIQDTYAGIVGSDAEKNAAIQAADKEFWATSAQLAGQNAEETMNLRHQVTEDALTGAAKVYQQEADSIESLDGKLEGSMISRREYEAQKVLLAQKAAEQIAALNDAAERETESLEKQARDASLQGDELVLAHKQDAISKAVQAYARGEIDYEQYQRRIVAANQQAQAQIAQNDQQAQEKHKRLMEQAAEDQQTAEETIVLATVNEWQRGYAQIELESQKRFAEIDKQERTALQDHELTQEEMLAIEQAAQAKRAAVWAETNQKIAEENKKQVEQLGADLQSVFDDITSGNIGQRILKNFEKLFFQILAQWLLTTQQMGSGFGSIFGSLLFGPGSSGANFFGGGASPLGALGGLFGGAPTSTPPFFPTGTTPFGGFTTAGGGAATGAPSGTSDLTSLLFPGFGSSSTPLAAASGLFPFATSNTTTASPFGLLSPFLSSSTPMGSAANALTTESMTQTLQLMSGGAVSGTANLSPLGGNFLGNLFSLKSAPGLASLALMFGGSALKGVGQVGAMISALSIMAAAGSGGGIAGAMLGALGPASGLVGTLLPLIGEGLLGFGIGMQTGPVLGSIVGGAAGAGIGALTAALAGFTGPIGAIIGGIVGLLSGLFGGLFGGSKRKKAAENYYTQQVQPAIKQVVDAYESFQLDFTSANTELEQLRSQAQDQLSKLKGEGKDEFKNVVSPAIDSAEKEISGYETERNRRAGLVFGPPQFHDGGLVDATAQAWTAKPGEVLAMLRHQEYVVNPQATAKNLSTLEAINKGAVIGDAQGTHIHIHAFDGPSVQQWLRRGGAAELQAGLQRHSQEGH